MEAAVHSLEVLLPVGRGCRPWACGRGNYNGAAPTSTIGPQVPSSRRPVDARVTAGSAVVAGTRAPTASTRRERRRRRSAHWPSSGHCCCKRRGSGRAPIPVRRPRCPSAHTLPATASVGAVATPAVGSGCRPPRCAAAREMPNRGLACRKVSACTSTPPPAASDWLNAVSFGALCPAALSAARSEEVRNLQISAPKMELLCGGSRLAKCGGCRTRVLVPSVWRDSVALQQFDALKRSGGARVARTLHGEIELITSRRTFTIQQRSRHSVQ